MDTKTPEQLADEYLQYDKESTYWAKNAFLAGYHTAYNIAYELGFEEALKAQKTLTYIQTELKKTNENP